MDIGPVAMDVQQDAGKGAVNDTVESEDLLKEHAEEPPHFQAEATPLLNQIWDTVVRVLADADPLRAGGAAGLVVIVLLFVFGRFGSLVLGLVIGLLLHAAIERRASHSVWRLGDRRGSRAGLEAISGDSENQELVLMLFSNDLSLATKRRHHSSQDTAGFAVSMGSCHPRLCGVVVLSIDAG